MLMITVEPTSNIKTVNQTHDALADALTRLNIQASDIVYISPATETQSALIIVRYNSMLHSRAKEYEAKNDD